MSVCLSCRITQTLLNGFTWNLEGGCDLGQNRPRYIKPPESLLSAEWPSRFGSVCFSSCLPEGFQKKQNKAKKKLQARLSWPLSLGLSSGGWESENEAREQFSEKCRFLTYESTYKHTSDGDPSPNCMWLILRLLPTSPGKFHQNSSVSFWVRLLKDRRLSANAQEARQRFAIVRKEYRHMQKRWLRGFSYLQL